MVSSPFPPLSPPLAAGLALWSVGLSIARSCRLTAVAGRLAPVLAPPFNPRRERRRDRSREAPATAGTRRAQLELSACWAPWLRWGRDGWQGRQRALALEATTVGQRLVVLVISVRSRGGAVPVAWKGLHATSKQPWQPEGVALLAPCPQVVPRGGTVLVRAARGVSARWLFHALVALGWHPRRRIHQPGQCRPHGWYHWVPVTTLVPRVDTVFSAKQKVHNRLDKVGGF